MVPFVELPLADVLPSLVAVEPLPDPFVDEVVPESVPLVIPDPDDVPLPVDVPLPDEVPVPVDAPVPVEAPEPVEVPVPPEAPEPADVPEPAEPLPAPPLLCASTAAGVAVRTSAAANARARLRTLRGCCCSFMLCLYHRSREVPRTTARSQA